VKIAILSDVHGNLQALEAVLADIGKVGSDALWSLGDAVGYGPEPQACVELLRREAAVNLMGNHDAAVAEVIPTAAFNESARLAVEWTRTVLDDEVVPFLAGLPYLCHREENLLVHASPKKPEAWNYIMSLGDAEDAFDAFPEKVCFVGHTHVPFVVIRKGDASTDALDYGEIVFVEDSRYLVNVGSVGQPRDGDPRASYAVLDSSLGRVEIRRVAYDVVRTQELMRRCGLPDFLRDRLSVGR